VHILRQGILLGWSAMHSVKIMFLPADDLLDVPTKKNGSCRRTSFHTSTLNHDGLVLICANMTFDQAQCLSLVEPDIHL
jgi:hypothetical protein